MRPILYITVIILITLTAILLTSWALDIPWIQGRPARVVLVHLMMLAELYLGYIMLREIVKKST